jgi:hypothetical protein
LRYCAALTNKTLNQRISPVVIRLSKLCNLLKDGLRQENTRAVRPSGFLLVEPFT